MCFLGGGLREVSKGGAASLQEGWCGACVVMVMMCVGVCVCVSCVWVYVCERGEGGGIRGWGTVASQEGWGGGCVVCLCVLCEEVGRGREGLREGGRRQARLPVAAAAIDNAAIVAAATAAVCDHHSCTVHRLLLLLRSLFRSTCGMPAAGGCGEPTARHPAAWKVGVWVWVGEWVGGWVG